MAGPPAGIGAQIGFKSETTWGTSVTVDQFQPFVNESIKKNIDRLTSKGLRAGRRSQHVWKAGKHVVGGKVQIELPNLNAATLLRHMFGTITTSGPAGSTYTHTASPGDLTGKSLTIQVGRPDLTGTVQPFTYAGCKFDSWELLCNAGEIAHLDLNVVAQSETTGTSLAAASYTSGLSPFVFVEGAITVGGSAVTTVKKINLKAGNTLDQSRFKVGSALVKEQLESGFRTYTGTIDADFESLTQYLRYVNANEFAVVLSFTDTAAVVDSLTITMNARFDGDTPVVGGEGLLDLPLNYTAISATSDAAAITAVLANTDATST